MKLLRSSIVTDDSKTTILIRIMVGTVFLSEGIQKFLFPETVGSDRFEKIGFENPEFWASITAAFEILCGFLVLAGTLTRLASIPLLVIMIVAFITTKYPILAEKGLWQMAHEYRTDFSMTIGNIFLLIMGGGKYSFDHHLMRTKSDA